MNVFVLIGHHQKAPVIEKDTLYLLETRDMSCLYPPFMNNKRKCSIAQFEPLT